MSTYGVLGEMAWEVRLELKLVLGVLRWTCEEAR